MNFVAQDGINFKNTNNTQNCDLMVEIEVQTRLESKEKNPRITKSPKTKTKLILLNQHPNTPSLRRIKNKWDEKI
jgi:hypothetical protein